jgi:hypothetical protein
VNKRLIGRKFCGNFGSLSGFGNVMIFASFQDFGKWDSRRQWLNKFVKCTNGIRGWCLTHSFGMPLIPQDFLNLKELISFCKSHGLILSGGLLPMASRRVWTLASTRRSSTQTAQKPHVQQFYCWVVSLCGKLHSKDRSSVAWAIVVTLMSFNLVPSLQLSQYIHLHWT